MFTLEIGNDAYQIKGDWTLDEWMNLKKYDTTMELLWPKFIHEATGAPIEQCVNIPHETLEVGVALIASLMAPSWSLPTKKYLRGELVDLNNMSIGQFIDCEVAIGRGLEQWLHLLVGSLYQVEPETTRSWEFNKVYGAVHNYLNWRLELYKKYDSLFEIEEGEPEPTENKTDAAYAWYDMLMMLADEKFLNIKDATERPVYEALNYVAWRKDKAKKEELERKKMKL